MSIKFEGEGSYPFYEFPGLEAVENFGVDDIATFATRLNKLIKEYDPVRGKDYPIDYFGIQELFTCISSIPRTPATIKKYFQTKGFIQHLWPTNMWFASEGKTLQFHIIPTLWHAFEYINSRDKSHLIIDHWPLFRPNHMKVTYVSDDSNLLMTFNRSKTEEWEKVHFFNRGVRKY